MVMEFRAGGIGAEGVFGGRESREVAAGSNREE